MIIYIEDNDTNYKLIVRAAALFSCQVPLIRGVNWNEGLGLIREHASHLKLILLDIHLPDSDMEQLAENVRQIRTVASCPIIALTAYAMRQDREKVMAAGVDFYLSKPLQIQELVRMVNTILEQSMPEAA